MADHSGPPTERHTRAGVVPIELSGRSMVWILGALASVWLFLELWPVLIVVVVALMIVGMLNPFVARLEHRGWPRRRAVAAVFVALLAMVAAFVALTIPRFFAQFSDLLDHFPENQATVARQLDNFKIAAPLAKSVRELRTTEVVAQIGRFGVSYSSRIVEVIAYSATSLFLSLYFMLDHDRMRGAAFALIPRSYHVRASRILLKLETIVGGYLRGQVITSALMIVFTYIVLSIARVPNAIAISLFAGAADVLPYVGAVLACGPAVLAALSRGTSVALAVGIVLLAYQEFESRFIVPRVYGQVLRLSSAAVMIALLVGGKLLGILGALLALPIAAGIRMGVDELRVELPGDASQDSAIRKLDEREEQIFERLAAHAKPGESAAIANEIAEKRLAYDARHPTDGEEASAKQPPSSNG